MANRKNHWSTFQKFLFTLISPFMTSPMPHIPELFISPSAPTYGWFEVNSWARAMQSCNDAAQCFVERVVHCKCEEGKRHEFLRFEIFSPEGSHTAIVFADRRVEVSQGVKQVATVLSPLPSPSASENLLATDVVWVATKGCPSETSLNNQFRNYIELRSLVFPHHGSRPSAQYLSALLQTTSMHKRYYELYKHQCYWFAHTVFESLQILHPSSLLLNGRHHKKCSQYCGSDFPIAESVDAVRKEFLEVWKTFLERKEEDQMVQQAKQELLLERGRTEGRAELEGRLEHEAERQKELERRLEHETECKKELERRLETQRLEHEAQRLEHEAERQQLLARIKAVELGAK